MRAGVHPHAVGPHEAQRAVVEPRDPHPALVHEVMREATQRDQVRGPGLAPVGPVRDVMRVDVAGAGTAREAAARVARAKQSPQRRRDRARLASGIERLAAENITGGCGNGNYCPSVAVTREGMAVFLLLAKEGQGYNPPACVTPSFNDVPCSSPFAKWIEELARRSITGGCGNGNYCPTAPNTRGQMAVFIVAAFGLQ